jgi:hypothetical protein
MRSLVFIDVVRLKNGGRGVRTHYECAAVFALFVVSK